MNILFHLQIGFKLMMMAVVVVEVVVAERKITYMQLEREFGGIRFPHVEGFDCQSFKGFWFLLIG
jgi:hypothetical protein